MDRAGYFQAFSPSHLITMVVIAALCVSIAFTAKLYAPPVRKWIGRAIAASLIAYAGFLYVQQGVRRQLSWEYSLPLDLCNLVLIACIISLIRPNRLLTEIAYFWGMGGGIQAVITPDLTRSFPSWDYILFFWSHGVTLVAISFLIAEPGFRPEKRSIVRMMVGLNVYGLIVGVLDVRMGWNYGYLCQKPGASSLFDYLGPWPWYLVSIELVALISFLLLYLPWKLGGPEGRPCNQIM
jgi:hypothetical integral membrane protein (TIGR02206 family)